MENKKIRKIIWLSFLFPHVTFAQGTWDCSYFYNPYDMMYSIWWEGFGWGLMSILIWIIFIWIIILLFRYSINDYHGPERRSWKSLDILKERYAEWTIDKMQYEEMKKDLEK